MTKINTSAMTPVIATVYELRFKVAAVKETVWNYLEDCSYEVNPGDIILNGTMGELWRVPKEKLVKKYENLDGTPIDPSAVEPGVFHTIRTKMSKDISWCIQVPIYEGPFETTTEQGDVLKGNREGVRHGQGDYIFMADNGGKPEPSWGAWVVNGNVFANTYQAAEI